jgi:hypothetical protein
MMLLRNQTWSVSPMTLSFRGAFGGNAAAAIARHVMVSTTPGREWLSGSGM